jgi:hypothetical protein
MNIYSSRPIGGYRVYVHEDGPTHTPGAWVEALKMGRVFVTNFPLLPEFSVDGSEAGSVLDRAGPSTVVNLHVHVQSILPVGFLRVLCNGSIIITRIIPWSPNGTDWSVDIPVTLQESSWLAVRVDGSTTSQAATSNALFAHSGTVLVRLDGAGVAKTANAGIFQDRVDSLQLFVEQRGNWPNATAHSHVLGILNEAHLAYGRFFHAAPDSFSLLEPADAETLRSSTPARFDWSDAHDSETGDRIVYQLSVYSDTLLFPVMNLRGLDQSEYASSPLPLTLDRMYWWRVWATDRGGFRTACSPGYRQFYYSDDFTAVESPGPSRVESGGLRLTAWPNPSTGRVVFALGGRPLAEGILRIFDPGGRLIRRLEPTAPRSGSGSRGMESPVGSHGWTWDGRDAQGHLVPSGLYWASIDPPASSGDGRRMLGTGARFLIVR